MGNKSLSKKSVFLKRLKKLFKGTFLFCVFFIFILYFFFPYAIVKNYFVSAIDLIFLQNNAFLNVNVKTLKPYWLTGIELKGVTVKSIYTNEQRHPLEIADLNARIALLPLFIGKAKFHVNVNLPAGKSDVFVSFPLFSLLSGNTEKFEVEANFKDFEIETLVDQYFSMLQNSNNPNLALLVPIISTTSIGGYLNGTLEFKSAKSQSGYVNLNLEKSYILIDDPNLNIPLQHFKQAKVNFAWEGEKYTVKENTIFESENLFINPRGNIQMIGMPAVPVLNLDLLLILSGLVEKNFSFLVPQLLKCPSSSMADGVMNIRLVGPATEYVCQ